MTRIESKVEKGVAIKKTALASESSFLANLAATGVKLQSGCHRRSEQNKEHELEKSTDKFPFR